MTELEERKGKGIREKGKWTRAQGREERDEMVGIAGRKTQI